MLNQLKQLKEAALGGRVNYTQYGVCNNIIDDINHKHIKSWSGFSGSSLYPIFDEFDEEYNTPGKQFNMINNLWQGRQLELRLDLLDHLIACYEREVSQC